MLLIWNLKNSHCVSIKILINLWLTKQSTMVKKYIPILLAMFQHLKIVSETYKNWQAINHKKSGLLPEDNTYVRSKFLKDN